MASALLIGCGEPAPSEPCLGEAPLAVTLPLQRLEGVSHEADGDREWARFAFDRAAHGEVTVTVEAPMPPYLEFSTGAPIAVKGDRLWSVRIDGLVGGAATDRMRADALDRYRIQEIVQVVDPETFRWVVGTVTGACVRLRADEEAGSVVLAVTPS
jgi:hypothetical protein